VAVTFKSAVDDPSRITKSKAVGALFGLTPKKYAFVYGEMCYRDVFGKRQQTKYRLMTGGPVGFADGGLVGCDEGNEAT
jgi:hypothetical protein